VHHPAEMMIHQYLENATSGKSAMSQETIEQVAVDIKDALNRQFNTKRDEKFRLRMSNIGRPSCQLWFEKNKPEKVCGNTALMLSATRFRDYFQVIGSFEEHFGAFRDYDTVTESQTKDNTNGNCGCS
jgi:hypothetical protein